MVQVYVINVSNAKGGLQRFCKRVSGVQYFLEHHYRYFYVLTNAPTSKSKKFSGDGYYLARCGDDDAHVNNLKNIIMPGDDICLEDMDIFHENLVLFLNKKGSPSICSVDMPIGFDCELFAHLILISTEQKEVEIDDLDPWYFPLPSNMCTITPGSNHDFTNTIYRAVLSSPVTPDLLVDYDMSKKIFTVVYQEDVRNISTGGVEKKTDVQLNEGRIWKDFSEKYACEEKEVVSRDGVKIPLTVVFSRSAYRKGLSPGLLHGYGAYGEALDKSWGGAGVDPSWHESGRGLNKLNSVYDFVSCGEYLIDEGFIHKNRLSALGISAGCILVGAAVPFLDVLNTLLDPSLPLTTMDYEEFGNPEIESCFECIRKYSPVGVWEAVKWVAKIRDTTCSRCSSAVILQTDLNGGHFREGGRFAHCWETAYDYAFLMKVMAPTDERT
ncbi:protease 2 [Phtheirospermum japonicum]|uniref:Prolyl endopeptidase n=1 Tax=Phtheirospermum japonicum TaxID=374723 RepID=A0A830C7N4_9LAMI|nr:protease 2 [Phtheirospermum japonicum]